MNKENKKKDSLYSLDSCLYGVDPKFLISNKSNKCNKNSVSPAKVTLDYLGGFLDGDGSIFAQIVRRKDYRMGFEIRCSVGFYQKSSGH